MTTVPQPIMLPAGWTVFLNASRQVLYSHVKSGTLCSQIPENPEVLESLVFKEVPADVEYAERKRIDSCQTEQHKSKFKRQDSHNAVGNKWKIKSRSTHRHVGPTLSLVKVNNNDQRRWHRQNYCHWTSTNWHKLHCGTGSNVALLRPTELLRRQWLDHCEGFRSQFRPGKFNSPFTKTQEHATTS